MLHRLIDPGSSRSHRARSPPRLVGDQFVVRGRDGIDLVERERAPGRRDQSQGLAATAGTARQSRQDEPREAAPQRCTGQLPSRREQLLHDQRVAGRPLGDEEQHRRRRTLALDRADQLCDLRAGQRPEDDALRRLRPLGESGKVAGERVVAGQAIRLVGRDKGETPVTDDAREEPDECPGRGVGGVDVLECKDEGTQLRDPTEKRCDGLDETALCADGRSDGRSRRQQVEALEPRGDLGQQSGDLLADRSHGGDQLPVGQPHDGGQDRLADRRERVATGHRPRGAAQDHERLAFRQEAAFNLVDQTRRAEPRHCLDEHGCRPALAGAGEHRAQVLEFTTSSYKGGTRDGERHGAF